MHDRDLYKQFLGLGKPWSILEVRLDAKAGQVSLTIDLADETELACPEIE